MMIGFNQRFESIYASVINPWRSHPVIELFCNEDTGQCDFRSLFSCLKRLFFFFFFTLTEELHI